MQSANPVVDAIVTSFINKSFELGEWLLEEKVINKDDLEDCENVILVGVPALSILHCIEKSSNFEDRLVHLAVDRSLDPEDHRCSEEIKAVLRKIVQAKAIYREIPFTTWTYDLFRKKMVLNHKNNMHFRPVEKNLLNSVTEIALMITQIDLYKQKFLNVVETLKALQSV